MGVYVSWSCGRGEEEEREEAEKLSLTLSHTCARTRTHTTVGAIFIAHKPKLMDSCSFMQVLVVENICYCASWRIACNLPNGIIMYHNFISQEVEQKRGDYRNAIQNTKNSTPIIDTNFYIESSANTSHTIQLTHHFCDNILHVGSS